MNAWAFVLGLATLVCMWLLSRQPWRSAEQRRAPSSDGQTNGTGKPRRGGLSWIEVAIPIAVVAILAAIALPSYQDYNVKSRVAVHAADLVQMRIALAETLASAETPEAKRHLERANDKLVKATEHLRTSANTEINTEFVALLTSATLEIGEATVAEPGLRTARLTADLAEKIRELEAAIASAQSPPAEQKPAPSRIWSVLFLGLLTLCVVVFLATYILLLLKHWNSRPSTFAGQLRARLEPLFAFFAFVLGIVLVLIPELSEAIALWGAGISGSGVGYWLKTFGSSAGTG